MTKQQVHDFWQEESCGERYAIGCDVRDRLEAQRRERYELEPYIREFARFEDARNRTVLEIGVGMGADHLEWSRQAPLRLIGMDLTSRSLQHTGTRFDLDGRHALLIRGDAERLPFHDGTFDLIYSWGVLHHTPDAAGAIREVHRVLRSGGAARVMMYHRASIVGGLLWMRYGVLRGSPQRTLDEIYAQHLESPGTTAYSVSEIRKLFSMFARVTARPMLSFADLLEGEAGARHMSASARLLRALWPRWAIRRWLRHFGLYLTIDAVK